MGRAPCCDKANVKKGPWSPEEDAKLKSYIEQHGTGGNWIALPQKIGLKRCGKSCRLRWLNYLRPNLKHGGFSEEEDRIICSLYITIGSRWSIIAAQLPGRTDNDIKNYWNTKLKKKLLGKQRKDQQQAARRGKQPVKPNNIPNNNNNDNDSDHQNPYWPELPVLAPLQAYEQSFYVPSTCSSSSFDSRYLNMLQGQGESRRVFLGDDGVEEIDIGMEFLCGGDGEQSMNTGRGSGNNSSGVGWWSDMSSLGPPAGGNALVPGQGGVMMPEYDFSELASTGGIVGDI